VENSGAISATGGKNAADNIAIDLAANAGGATVKQIAVGEGKTAPSITGDVRFGSGNDVFDIADGTVKGNTSFGAGNNQLKLSGDAVYTGNAVFGGGNDNFVLEGASRFTGLADFGGGSDMLSSGGYSVRSGALANSSGLGGCVNGGAFDVEG